jgi:hypothetical protein
MGRQGNAVRCDRDGTVIKDMPHNGDLHRAESPAAAAHVMKSLCRKEIHTDLSNARDQLVRES